MGQLSNAGSSTSSSLLLRLKRHDPQAWERLVELYGPLVFSWGKRSGLTSADAADVLQDVFVSVYRGLERFQRVQPGDSFRGWLWTITRNQIRDHLRRELARATAAGGTDAYLRLGSLPAHVETSSANEMAPDATTRLLRRALELVRQQFEPHTFQAFWRVVVEGHSTAEVAEDLGISPNSVRQAKSRVARRLRMELGDLLE